MIQDEGYIKFNPTWERSSISIELFQLKQLNDVRTQLKTKNWLGILPNGIGFGNISFRVDKTNQFIITGSATGKYSLLEEKHLSLVNEVNIEKNTLKCNGKTVASSESMSHAAIYMSNENINTVIHIHASSMWKRQLNKLPTSRTNASYGTPEMAFSIAEELKQIPSNSGVLIMGGHEDGIIAFGTNLVEIYQQLCSLE